MSDTEVSIKFNNKVTGEKKLEKYAEQLKTINSVLSGLNTGAMKQIQGSADSIKSMDTDMQDLKNKASGAFDYLKVTKFYGAIKKLGESFASLSKKSIDYLENFNLFQVAFKGNYQGAERFINKMSEMFGLDESWLTQTVGKFKQLTNAMNLTAETGEKVSELLTQMSLDISSLYNVDIDRASQTLMSAMAGQTKPIRGTTGGDITVPTLQTTLDQLGIDRAVNSLSYAEKRLLIIISLTRQLSASIGDMGRTIESPANQLRVMHEQWERLSRAVGNLFLPILKTILPYLNAMLMVITEIISALASLIGYNREDYDYFDDSAASAWDLDAGIKSATGSAKKLKQGLRGFDKLNNITTPSSGGGGAGGAGGGGISKGLLNEFNKAFDDYQKKFGDIKMRATEIRDKIMEWLGFTKLVDEKTGDVSFKFDHITGGTVLGALAVGGVIFRGVSTIFGILRKIGILKFPVLEGLFGKIFGGKAGAAADSLKGAAGLGDTVKSTEKSFKLPSIKTVLTGLAELAIVIGGLTLLVVAIGEFMRIPTVKEATTTGIKMVVEVFKGIGSIFIPLALVTAGMLGLGMTGGAGVAAIATGLADLAIVIVGTTALITAIGALMTIEGVNEAANTGINIIIKIFEGISSVLIPLGLVTAGLLALGLTGVGGTGVLALGLADLAIVLGGMTVVVAAMGKLTEWSFVKNNLDNGINLIVKLANGLGRIVGAFAGGLVAGAVESIAGTLPTLGTSLSQFMANAQLFFDNINKVNKSSTEAVKDLAQVILILTANNIITGLTSWLVGDMSLADFGVQLKEFAPNFVAFTKSIEKLTEGSINKAKIVGKIMIEIINFAKEIPNSGGVVGWFVGENDLADFGKSLPAFGKHVTEFSNKISSIGGGIESKTVTLKNAMLNIIDFAKKIPNDGGVVGFFTGNNNIADFGKNLKNFGGYFKEYADKVKGITFANINQVSTAVGKIVEWALKIKQNGLEKTMKDFGSSLKSAADDISKFFKTAFNESGGKTAGETFGKGIVKGIKNSINNGKIKLQLKDSNGVNAGGSYSFKATASYAKGGLPPVGQIFVANEKGAELVGHIGGQSFVANQNQVVDLLDKKLGQAKANPMNATFIIQVGTREVAKEVITDLQDLAKTNGKPITIGG